MLILAIRLVSRHEILALMLKLQVRSKHLMHYVDSQLGLLSLAIASARGLLYRFASLVVLVRVSIHSAGPQSQAYRCP